MDSSEPGGAADLDEPGAVDRLTFFVDAAIALTLFILPVSEYVIDNPAVDWTTLFAEVVPVPVELWWRSLT